MTFWLYAVAIRRANYTRRLLPLRRASVQSMPPRIRVEDVAIAYALIPPKHVGLPYYMVEEGDVRCLYLVHTMLTGLFGKDNVYAVNEEEVHGDVHTRPNLVVLSGPVWNKTMELYLGLSGSPIRFAWDGNDLKLVASSGTEYRSTYVGEHRVKRCHGLLLAGCVSAGGFDQRLVIVAGCSNLSTYAGAVLLSRLSKDRTLRSRIKSRRLHKDRCWAIVYCVENWAEDPASYDVIPTMRSGALRLSVTDTFRANAFEAPYEFHLGPKPVTQSPYGED